MNMRSKVPYAPQKDKKVPKLAGVSGLWIYKTTQASGTLQALSLVRNPTTVAPDLSWSLCLLVEKDFTVEWL